MRAYSSGVWRRSGPAPLRPPAPSGGPRPPTGGQPRRASRLGRAPRLGRACVCVCWIAGPTTGRARRRADQPWRCLWRGSVQMTMTRPCRRITRHLLQILLTLGLTFTVALLHLHRVRHRTSKTDRLPGRRQATCSGRRCARGSGRTAKVRRRPGPPEGCGCSAAASCR